VFLMRPYVTFQLAAISGGVAEIAKMPQDREQTRRHARRTTLLATGVAVLNGLVLVFLPDSVGRLILGDTWRHAEPLMLATAVQLLLLGLNSGARTALTGARMVRTSTRLDLALAPTVLVGAVAGALVGGAQGFVWATALVTAISVIAWWVPFGWYLRGRGEQPRVEVAAVSPDVR
jgi:O-antigen/teichoic acid export membrane protein